MKKTLTLLLFAAGFSAMAANVNSLNNLGGLEPMTVNGSGACVTSNIQGTLSSGFLGYVAGIGTHAILIDPTGSGAANDPGCGGDFTGMVFDVQDVTFNVLDESIFGAGDGLGVATYEVSLHGFSVPGDSLQGPGPAFATETQVFTANASGQYQITTAFAAEEAITEPFFVSWKLISFVPDVSPTGTISLAWDSEPRPLGRQFIDNDGNGFIDHENFFIDGDAGWIDVVVTGDFYQQGPPPMVPSLGVFGLILMSLGLMWLVRSRIKA